MKHAIITVDTEAPAGKNPIDSLIYGKTEDGQEYGISSLMSLFDKYGYKGLFFVDVAEAWDNGEDKIAGVIKHIITSGHDVGVHIHPDHMADSQRRFLWEYSYDEQYKIIKNCTDLFTSITGEKPRSFRAGRYGANDDTLKIISQLRYEYDFSEFPHNKRCKLTFDGRYNQRKCFNNELIEEIPVSVFQSFKTPFYHRFDKIDVAQPFSEYKAAINTFNDDSLIVFFAHSFSLLKWRKDPNHPVFERSTYNKIEKMLAFLKENNINVVSESQLRDIPTRNESGFITLAHGIKQYVYFSKRAFTTFVEKMTRDV